MRHRSDKSESGFTLLEALLAAVILAAGVAAITLPFAAGARNEQIDARRTIAVGLAEEIIETILTLPFEDEDPAYARNLGPDPGEYDRSLFDNIDDYHEYIESEGEITSVDGQAFDDLSATGLSRQVSTEYIYISGQSMIDPPSFIRVTVEVLYKQQPVVTLTRLIYAVPG